MYVRNRENSNHSMHTGDLSQKIIFVRSRGYFWTKYEIVVRNSICNIHYSPKFEKHNSICVSCSYQKQYRLACLTNYFWNNSRGVDSLRKTGNNPHGTLTINQNKFSLGRLMVKLSHIQSSISQGKGRRKCQFRIYFTIGRKVMQL